MNEVLEAKLKEYKKSSFENKDFKAWLKDSNIWMAEYSCLRVKGIEMSKKELVDVVEGKIMEDLPLDLYGFVHRFIDAYKEMQASIGMLETMNESLFNKIYDILIEGDGYRKDNPVIYKWNYIAPHFNDISKNLNALFKTINQIGNPVKRAIRAHEGVLAIFPYNTDTEVMASVAFFYELMAANIPLPSFTADSFDYNTLVSKYLSAGSKELSEMLERSLINRLDSVIMYGIESKEK